MFDVYICDNDEAFTRRCSEQILKQASEMKETEKQPVRLIVNLPDPDQILETCREMDNTGLFFLNIEPKSGAGGIDGIELAQRVRSLQPNCYISFLSTHTELAFAVIEAGVEPLGYIVKGDPNLERNKIKKCICLVVEKEKEIERYNRKMAVLKLDTSVNIKLSDIIHVEAMAGHKAMVRTVSGEEETRLRLKDIMLHLDSRFFEYSRSMIINLEYIDLGSEGNAIILKDKGELLISEDARKQIVEKIKDAELKSARDIK